MAGINFESAMAELEEKLPGMVGHMEPDAPGMHTTDTVDFEVVLSGEVVLELDDGAEVTLKQGDTVVQNGTRHAWHNRGRRPRRDRGRHHRRHPLMSEHVLYEASDGIGTITLNRPEKRNAMTFVMLAEFIETVRKAGADDDARVVIVTGSGGSFCAGTDLSDLNTIPGETRGVRGEAEEHDVWWPLAACPKPVIAAVDGPAVGMGAEFTSQCDVRICSTNARFAWNFVHRGLVPDTGAGTWLLPRLIGMPAALKLLYSGAFLSADEALELGYVAQVVEPDGLQSRGPRARRRVPRRVPVLAAAHQGARLQGHGARPRLPHARARASAAGMLQVRGPQGGRGVVPRAAPGEVHRTLNAVELHRTGVAWDADRLPALGDD